MHPTLLLALWLCVVVLAQRVSALVLVPILCASVFLCPRETRNAWTRLVVRSRWLLVVLVATTVLLIPGESLWPGMPVTEEGVVLACGQLSRLLFILFAVAWLVTRWSAQAFAGALYGVASHMGVVGARQAAVRLALTLRAIGESPGNRPLWRDILADASAAPDAGARLDPIIFEHSPLRTADQWMILLAVGATGVLWWALP